MRITQTTIIVSYIFLLLITNCYSNAQTNSMENILEKYIIFFDQQQQEISNRKKAYYKTRMKSRPYKLCSSTDSSYDGSHIELISWPDDSSDDSADDSANAPSKLSTMSPQFQKRYMQALAQSSGEEEESC